MAKNTSHITKKLKNVSFFVSLLDLKGKKLGSLCIKNYFLKQEKNF